MKSINPFLKIEWKNRNYILYIAVNIVGLIALAELVKLGKVSYSTSAILFSISTFVFFGLFWSIAMLENLKNDQTSNLIKTFVSYPVTSVEYILSKIVIFLVSNVISSVIGSLIAFVIIGNLNLVSLELFISDTFYAILASTALFLIVSLISKFGLVSEIILVFYYFVIFFMLFSMISVQVSLILTIFPYMIFFSKILSLPVSGISIANLVEFPVIYIILILLAFIILKILKWYPLFKYD